MLAIRYYLRTLGANHRGATAIEYGLIAALIAVSIISALKSLGGGAGGMWGNLSNIAQNAM